MGIRCVVLETHPFRRRPCCSSRSLRLSSHSHDYGPTNVGTCQGRPRSAQTVVAKNRCKHDTLKAVLARKWKKRFLRSKGRSPARPINESQAQKYSVRAPFSIVGRVLDSRVLMRFGDQIDQTVRRIEFSTCERSNGHPTWGRRLRPSVEARLVCSFRSNCRVLGLFGVSPLCSSGSACRDLGLFGCSGSPVLCGLCAFGPPRGPLVGALGSCFAVGIRVQKVLLLTV